MTETGKDPVRISFLLQKYLNGACSKDEAQEIVYFLEDSRNDISLIEEVRSQWHTINTDHQNELDTLENQVIIDQILGRLHLQIRFDEEEIIRKSSAAKVFALFSRIAAILILPLLVYSIYLTSRVAKVHSTDANCVVWQTFKTPAGIQSDFLLPDGSHVWLNSGSVLKYPIPFAKDIREVEFTGEAFFDITKDASRPFLVNAGKMNIEVKGTRFDVINYPDESLTELILESGNVRLFSGNYKDNNTITNINPGELAVLDNTEDRLSVRKVEVAKYIAWKEGMLIFRDDPMDEVVRTLNRWFNVEIILKSPELKAYVYTATYRDETLPQILELLKISAPIKYSIPDRKRLGDNSYTKRKILLTKLK